MKGRNKFSEKFIFRKLAFDISITIFFELTLFHVGGGRNFPPPSVFVE